MNSLLEVNEAKRPSIHELAGDFFIKSMIASQQKDNGLLKKREEIPLINLNQPVNQLSQS